MRLVCRNFKIQKIGELDLVFLQGKTLVFVEVKTRAPSSLLRASDAVDQSKRKHLLRASRAFIREFFAHQKLYYRYDIMEIYLEEGRIPECSWVQDINIFR